MLLFCIFGGSGVCLLFVCFFTSTVTFVICVYMCECVCYKHMYVCEANLCLYMCLLYVNIMFISKAECFDFVSVEIRSCVGQMCLKA